ncbi:MAG: helix-turn-helix domain-containing protein [Verrucomicrobia bacterium]|nr:helix-turn-helix domain-containing protein [Verrucomicrobiota bacterium]
MTSDLISPKELARRWHVSANVIRRRRQSGELPAVHLGGNLYRFRLSDILAIEGRARGDPRQS